MPCFHNGDVTVRTYDPQPFHILLNWSRSYAYVGEDWYPGGGYTAISQAFNRQFPPGCHTTSAGTDWCRDPGAASTYTTPSSTTSPIPAEAWQRQKYYNKDFLCPLDDCGWYA